MSDRYSFGTGAVAARRLHLVARVFEPAMAALLETVGIRRAGRLLDLGCGPGSSTGSLTRPVDADEVIGLDASPAFLAEAGERLPNALFVLSDVTDPWPGPPPDLAYARCLLAHLSAPVAVAGGWRAQLAPGGVLLLEEPEAIETSIDVFRRYLEITAALVASRGASMYAGRELREHWPSALVDRGFGLDVTAADAAALFTMNLASWRDDPWITEHVPAPELDRLADELHDAARRSGEVVHWTVRQLALPAPDAAS